MKEMALATAASGVWISLSEFLRNEFLFKRFWLDKYESLGLEFPSSPVNGALWGVWSFVFAGCLAVLLRRMSFTGTIALGWTMGFVLMWIAVGNLNALPLRLLPVAVPWSLAEVGLAVVIARRILGDPERGEHVRQIPEE